MINILGPTGIAGCALYPLSFLEASFCENFAPRTSALRAKPVQIAGTNQIKNATLQ
jgi:hypothetical protein